VAFPKLVLWLSRALVALPELLIGVILITGLALYLGFAGMTLLWMIPGLIILIWVSLGASLWSFSFGGRYRDVQQVLPYAIQMLFFLSPIIYPSGLFGDLLTSHFENALYVNPVVSALDIFRLSVFETELQWYPWLLSLGMGTLLFVGGLFFYHKEDLKWQDQQ
jgi:lipopolysaccharide transport system permease protein